VHPAPGEGRAAPEHCGLPMRYQEVFGIRVWYCAHRSYHEVIFENLYTGQRVGDDELEMHDE
jgi:hypothetical protein